MPTIRSGDLPSLPLVLHIGAASRNDPADLSLSKRLLFSPTSLPENPATTSPPDSPDNWRGIEGCSAGVSPPGEKVGLSCFVMSFSGHRNECFWLLLGEKTGKKSPFCCYGFPGQVGKVLARWSMSRNRHQVKTTHTTP